MSAVDLWWSILSAFLALNFNADTQIHFPFLSSFVQANLKARPYNHAVIGIDLRFSLHWGREIEI